MIQAGKLRHRVTVQRYALGSPQQTATGATDGAWADYITVWSSIEPVSGREPFLAQAHLSEITHKIRMRYHEGITAAMRISWNGRLFDIKASTNWEERNRELQLLCIEGVNEG
jgi:SPP1 family predicted phage head-tail adaptor